LSFALTGVPLFAQQGDTEILASGGESYETMSDLILSWTIGETVVDALGNGQYILAQGFHQPTIRVTKLTQQDPLKGSNISIFPNPVMDFVKINLSNEFSQETLQNVKAELRNIEGRLIHEGTFSTGEYSIDMQMIANGAYILRITSASGELLASSKIEKLK